MSVYRLEKRSVPVVLLLAPGSTLSGSLYLSDCSPVRSGGQSVEDLLLEPDPMLAFAPRDGRFLVIGKRHVAAVECEADRSSLPGFWPRTPVLLELAGGHRIQGKLLTEEGPGIRFSDALNAAAPWIAVETEGSVFWVSKAHILTAEARTSKTLP